MAFAYLNKESGKWIVGWKDARGRQQRKTTPLKEREGRKAALRIAQQLEREAWEVSQGLKKERTPDVTVAEAVELYLAALPEDYASRKNLEGRLRNYVVPGLGADTLVREVTPAHVMGLLSSLKSVKKDKAGKPKALSPQTREHIRMAGQGLYTFLTEKAHLFEGKNPFKEAGPVRVPRREVRHFEASHLPLLMAQLPPHYVAICAAAVTLAVRKGELRDLLKRNWHEAERYVLVQSGGHTKTTKGGRERRVPVPAVLVPVLREQMKTPGPYLFPRPGPEGAPYAPKWSAHRVIARACKRAGLPEDLRFKHLRSTWGTLAYAATGDIRLVQAVLGHANVATTTAHYARALPEHLQAGSEKVAQALDFTTKRGGGK